MLSRSLSGLFRWRIRLFEQPFRSTWVLRHVFAPEPTPPGQEQRRPEELPNLMKYEVIDFESKYPAGTLKVILLEDVEGVGQQFDVLEVNRKLARTDLLPGRKAVYASPFDLHYYGAIKERRKDELASRIRIPYDYLVVGRYLLKMVVPIHVSMDNPWTIDSVTVKCSLRQAGVVASEEAIFIENETISGPNLELEARFIRFYLVICKQYIVPMIGRISHISTDDSKQQMEMSVNGAEKIYDSVLSPELDKLPSEKELAKYGISAEEPYYHKTPEMWHDFDVVKFMKTRRRDMNDE